MPPRNADWVITAGLSPGQRPALPRLARLRCVIGALRFRSDGLRQVLDVGTGGKSVGTARDQDPGRQADGAGRRLLLKLIPGGVGGTKTSLPAARAKAMLARVRLRDAASKALCLAAFCAGTRTRDNSVLSRPM